MNDRLKTVFKWQWEDRLDRMSASHELLNKYGSYERCRTQICGPDLERRNRQFLPIPWKFSFSLLKLTEIEKSTSEK